MQQGKLTRRRAAESDPETLLPLGCKALCCSGAHRDGAMIVRGVGISLDGGCTVLRSSAEPDSRADDRVRFTAHTKTQA